MRQIVQVSEQHLSQIATDLRTRMLEIKELRAAIQSAEAAKALPKSASPDTFRVRRRFVNAREGVGPATHTPRIAGKRAYGSLGLDR